MDKKIRFGLIGIGAQGGAYAGFLTGTGGMPGMPAAPCPPHCALGALCDIDPEKEKMCKEKYPDIPFYKDWKEMVASGNVDAVITTVPHYLHHEIAIYCLEHGMNVLVEKPAGVRAKDVLAMNALRGRPSRRGLRHHVQPAHQQAVPEDQGDRRLRRAGRDPPLQLIINTWWRPDSYYRQSDWRATWGGEGGGVLVNQAPHQLDLWQWICGIPNKVYAKCLYGCHRDIIVENDVTVVTQYPNGATGSFITCTHDAIGTDRLEIDLDAGKIVVEDSKKATVYRMKKSEPEMERDHDHDGSGHADHGQRRRRPVRDRRVREHRRLGLPAYHRHGKLRPAHSGRRPRCWPPVRTASTASTWPTRSSCPAGWARKWTTPWTRSCTPPS